MSRASVAERAPSVDPRFEQRRRQVADAQRRRRARRALAVPVAATLVAAAWGVTRSAALDVDDVVVTGAAHSGTDAVVGATGVTLGDALVDVDAASVATAVEALPWVERATVERRWRDGVVAVAVEERSPAALVVGEGAALVVDATGRVLESVPAPADGSRPPGTEGLVTVEGVALAEPGQQLGPEASDALVVAASLSAGLSSRVAAVRPGESGVELRLVPSGTVRFGAATEVDEKVRTLQTVFADVQLDCLASVDVRVSHTAVLTREPSCL